jgi:hypothetical protein
MNSPFRTLISLLPFLFATATARADEGIPVPPDHPLWRSECGSCHVPYPPSLLTASSWRSLMSGLDKHFGNDASLDDKIRANIARYLERNAATAPRLAAKTGRITDTAWFRHEHDEVPARVWRTVVKSPAQCEACHRGAANGRYGEGEIRIPGVTAKR